MSGKTVSALMKRDPSFVSRFVVSPKATLAEYGIDEESLEQEEIDALEMLAEQSQDNLRTNAKLIGIQMEELAWGIGASCCSSKGAAFTLGGAGPRRR